MRRLYELDIQHRGLVCHVWQRTREEARVHGHMSVLVPGDVRSALYAHQWGERSCAERVWTVDVTNERCEPIITRVMRSGVASASPVCPLFVPVFELLWDPGTSHLGMRREGTTIGLPGWQREGRTLEEATLRLEREFIRRISLLVQDHPYEERSLHLFYREELHLCHYSAEGGTVGGTMGVLYGVDPVSTSHLKSLRAVAL